MELITKLLDAIPNQYKLPLILLVMFLYFGAPVWKNWKSNKSYWDFRQKEIELSKLFYEAESARTNAKVEALPSNLLEELAAQRSRLRPNFERKPLPYWLRLIVSAAGALTALLAITLTHYFRGAMPLSTALAAALIQAVLPALAASAYLAEAKFKAFWFAFGSGVLFHILTIVVYLATSTSAP